MTATASNPFWFALRSSSRANVKLSSSVDSTFTSSITAFNPSRGTFLHPSLVRFMISSQSSKCGSMQRTVGNNSLRMCECIASRKREPITALYTWPSACFSSLSRTLARVSSPTMVSKALLGKSGLSKTSMNRT
ncbi:hypothetical protein KP509_04G101000 [Ceratopteris richardii]|uniref:Uncharacterized protein n=1 Tax=Ceratopteris richardii TaxID=49495 RepID=A0A8T2UYL7_CERRI|nr:hypothetical protein KP509_04G101000 [Ceratopteris richardii]